MNGKFWMRQLAIGRLTFSIVYNSTFSMTDGPVHAYFHRADDFEQFRSFSLRIGHLWLNVDYF